jgi:hypothetical protein
MSFKLNTKQIIIQKFDEIKQYIGECHAFIVAINDNTTVIREYSANISEDEKQNLESEIKAFNVAINDNKEVMKLTSKHYEQAEKIAALINQVAGKLQDGDIYKQADTQYNEIMNDPEWGNQINFGQVLATEQHNRNLFNEIVYELSTKGIDGFNPQEYYICEVFENAAKSVNPNFNDKIVPFIKRTDDNCDG